MALNIKNSVAEQLAKELAEATGESLTQAVIDALRRRLVEVRGVSGRRDILAEVATLQAFVRTLPVLDPRRAESILEYDAHGLPT